MIAIVILGIGMVMVATVFPIGIDMAAQTVQMNIAQAVVDNAMATLNLKVPVAAEFDQIPSGAASLVLIPDVSGTDLYANIQANEAEVLTRLRCPPPPLPNPIPGPSYKGWGPLLQALPELNTGGFLDQASLPILFGLFNPPPDPPNDMCVRARVFTERSAWGAQSLVLATADPPLQRNRGWEVSFVLPAQNLWPDYGSSVHGIAPGGSPDQLATMLPVSHPPVIAYISPPPPPAALPSPWVFDFPRVNMSDQVYPPVPVTYFDQATGRVLPRPAGDVLRDIAQSRYSWIAVHHTVSAAQMDQLMVTILVTHRSDLSARYARQDDQVTGSAPYNPTFNLADAATLPNLYQPKPDPDQTTDMLFPQPWLVYFETVDLGSGTVSCTGWVARLLPPGSFFVIARKAGNLHAGTPHEVLARGPIPTDLDDPTTLTVKRSTGAAGPVFAWVVPPAIQRMGTNDYRFQNRSSVAGVAPRTR